MAAAVAMAAAVGLCGCAEDEDLLVHYVQKNALTEQGKAKLKVKASEIADYYEKQAEEMMERLQKGKKAIDAKLAKNADVETDPENPNVAYKDLAVDKWVYLPETGKYVGYVDLGLSVYWAVANVGTAGSDLHTEKPFKDFFNGQKPVFEADRALVGKPTSADYAKIAAKYKSGNGVKTMPWSEYKKGKRVDDADGFSKELDKIVQGYKNSLETQLNRYDNAVTKYEAECEAYTAAYAKAKEEYYAYLMDTKWAFLAETGGFVQWGSNSLWTGGRRELNGKQAPLKLDGKETDAAANLWGTPWRTPSGSEMEQLASACKWTQTTIGKITGVVGRGPSGKAIFLPQVGFQDGDRLQVSTSHVYGVYMTSERPKAESYFEYFYSLEIGVWGSVAFKSNETFRNYCQYAHSVRPVYPK